VINYISLKIIEILDSNNSLSYREKDLISYSLNSILNDLSKVLMLLIIFSFFDLTLEFALITLFSIPIRISAGGYHFKSYLGCFIFTLFYYLSIIFISKIDFNTSLTVIIYLISSTLLIYFAPYTSKKRESLRVYSLKFYKCICLILIFIYLLIYMSFTNNYVKIGLFVIIIQSLQLTFLKGVKFYELKRTEYLIAKNL